MNAGQVDLSLSSGAAYINRCYTFRRVELAFRSLNNILEHLHQSFFVYVLPSNGRLISISHYVGAGVFSIVALMVQALMHVQRAACMAHAAYLVAAVVVVNAASLQAGSQIIPTAGLGAGLAFLAAVQLAIASCAWSLTREKISPLSARVVGSLFVSVALTMLLMTNFGYGLFCSLVYAPLLYYSGGAPAKKWRLFAPLRMLALVVLCPLSLVTASFLLAPRGHSQWATYIGHRLMSWNSGLPFLVVQPMLTLFASLSSDERGAQQPSKAKVH